MAGDWIKIELALPDKPEIDAMASALSIDHDAVVGKLIRVWSWADQNTISGSGIGVTCTFLDRIAFCPGFAGAMRKAGWLAGRDGALEFPRFDRHNGQTAKGRAMTNRRVASHRTGTSPPAPAHVTPPALQKPLPKPLPEKTREEKRREEEDRVSVTSFPGHPPSPATPAVVAHTPQAPSLSGNESPEIPDWSDFLKEATRLTLPEWRARDLFEEMEAVGWRIKKQPVTNWKSLLRRVFHFWETDGRLLQRPNWAGNPGFASGRSNHVETAAERKTLRDEALKNGF